MDLTKFAKFAQGQVSLNVDQQQNGKFHALFFFFFFMYKQHQTTPCTSCVFVNRRHLSDSVSLLKETSNVFTVLDNKLSKPLNKAVERDNKTSNSNG